MPVPTQTLVMDAGSGRQLLRIDGLVTLPVGSRIQLGTITNPPVSDGIVTGVRLWGAAPPGRPLLVLDVMLAGPGEMTDSP